MALWRFGEDQFEKWAVQMGTFFMVFAAFFCVGKTWQLENAKIIENTQ